MKFNRTDIYKQFNRQWKSNLRDFNNITLIRCKSVKGSMAILVNPIFLIDPCCIMSMIIIIKCAEFCWLCDTIPAATRRFNIRELKN